jgi:hypothetical protein
MVYIIHYIYFITAVNVKNIKVTPASQSAGVDHTALFLRQKPRQLAGALPFMIQLFVG